MNATTPEIDSRERTRRILHHMLTVRTPAGMPVVSTSLLLLELAEDVNEAWWREVTPDTLLAWAFGRPLKDHHQAKEAYAAAGYFSANVDYRYRVMVSAVKPVYPVHWLCEAPSVAWGDPKFPAWDHTGKKVV